MTLDSRVVGPPAPHLLETEIEDEISVYDPQNEQVTVLNGTASDIWRLADGSHTLDQIVDLLASAYQVPRSRIANEVEQTVQQLMSASLLSKE